MIGISDLEYLCAEVRQIARKAGAFLRDERQKFDRERVEEKSAHNYVSYVDKESERRLVEQLSTLLPEAGFIAEEGSGSLTDEEYCWVIDPLDGTSNYIHDMAPYSVSIALRDREELLLGVVYEVCRNECFYAWKGSKAYLDGKEIRVTDVAVLDKAFVALGFPYDSDHYRPIAQKLVDRLYGYAGGNEAVGICCGRALLRRLWAIRCSDRRTSRPVGCCGRRLDPDAGGWQAVRLCRWRHLAFCRAGDGE